MDLLFSKYASPYSLLEEVLSVDRLAEFVYSTVEIDNERKLWEIYLSCVSNPYAEVGSFEEFKQKNTIPSINKNINLGATVNDSMEILTNFNPEIHGGES